MVSANDTIASSKQRPTRALREYQSYMDALEQDSAQTAFYFKILADYIDHYIAPTGTAFPVDADSWQAFNTFHNGYPLTNSDQYQAYNNQPFLINTTTQEEAAKWEYFLENPQIYRQMVHYMGRERSDCFLSAIYETAQRVPDGGLPRDQHRASERFVDYHRQAQLYLPPAVHLKDLPPEKIAKTMWPADAERCFKRAIQRTRPTGTWQGWINEKPRIPEVDSPKDTRSR